MTSFRGKVAVVTGAGRGIGRAAALAFARAGAAVAACSRTASELESLAAEIRAAGGRARIETCDVSSSRQVDAFVAGTVAAFGGIDVLINNAGILGPRAPLSEISDEDWRSVLGANLDSVFYATRAALRASMLARGKGCVINVSSGQGRKATARWGAYAASKFGVEGLTMLCADEHRGGGLRFYSVNPTATRTALRAAAFPDEDPSSLKDPESAARALLELASEDCPFPSGSAVYLDRVTGKIEAA